eukprot:gene3905-biopygen11289
MNIPCPDPQLWIVVRAVGDQPRDHAVEVERGDDETPVVVQEEGAALGEDGHPAPVAAGKMSPMRATPIELFEPLRTVQPGQQTRLSNQTNPVARSGHFVPSEASRAGWGSGGRQ